MKTRTTSTSWVALFSVNVWELTSHNPRPLAGPAVIRAAAWLPCGEMWTENLITDEDLRIQELHARSLMSACKTLHSLPEQSGCSGHAV